MFDCCFIHDEMDLLEIRFNTLNDTVERFVVVESNKTHSGKTKELNFVLNKERFRQFLPKIIYIVHNGLPSDYPNFNPWMNENGQRDAVLESLWYARPNDGLLLISDVDEIVRPEKAKEAADMSFKTHTPVSIQITNCMYYMNMVSDTHPVYWGAYIYNPYHPESPTTLRWRCCDKNWKYSLPNIENGGWHFSTLGGIDRIKLKLQSYAHTREFNVPEVNSDENLTKCMKEGIIFHDPVYKFDGESPHFSKREDLSFLPPYVLNNMERFKKYIL
jgi:beta-1,4-mannosyl-glycoprotein beta-1,4-N-acetylglucosaminyltransferase